MKEKKRINPKIRVGYLVKAKVGNTEEKKREGRSRRMRKEVVGCVQAVVCVLTGLHTEQYEQIMRWWGSNPQSGIAKVLDSAAYCYVIIPCCPCYYSTRQRYHTSSSDHLDVPYLRPSPCCGGEE